MSVNWTVVYNRLFKLIDQRDRIWYYSGPNFIDKVQEVKEDFPSYHEFLEICNRQGKSTARKAYFKDILMSLTENERASLVYRILDDLEQRSHPRAPITELRGIVRGTLHAPVAKIPADQWNGERLQMFLGDIEQALQEKKPERVLTLSYTCIEGFFRAYVQKHIPDHAAEKEITALAKLVREDLKSKNGEYPTEIFNVVSQTGYAINKVRNGFSESHFGEEADIWLAMYVRDLVNTISDCYFISCKSAADESLENKKRQNSRSRYVPVFLNFMTLMLLMTF